MLLEQSSRLAVLAVFLAALAGCGSASELASVEGKVTFAGNALTTGAVTFHPDALKGNKTAHIPHGEIDAQGNYRLLSATKPGAPPGWYKVTVRATKPFDPKRPTAPEEWLIPKKYGDPQKSGLAIQVVDTPAPGAYDLPLQE